MTEREPPHARDHDTYVEGDHWTVFDIEDIDSLFVASPLEREDEPEIRVDLDGFFAKSDQAGEPGENANASVWFDMESAIGLYVCLQIALREAAEAGHLSGHTEFVRELDNTPSFRLGLGERREWVRLDEGGDDA